MHLIRSTDDYLLSTRPTEGFPILLWEDMSSCQEVNDFLRYYLTRGSIGSRRTWEVIAVALYDYFGFLEANELRWNDVDHAASESMVSAYARYSAEVHRLSRNTIRLRLTYICEFYDHAVASGWITKLPYRMESRLRSAPSGFFAHVDASAGRVAVRSVMPRKHRSLIKYLSADQVRTLLSSTENEHHKIILQLAVGSGLRREELATFPRSYVFDPDRAARKTANVAVHLDPADGSGMRTKGGKARTILISATLMKRLHHYAERRRGERIARGGGDAPSPLFLTERGEPWADAGKGIEVMVRNVGQRVGIKVHPHMLRHTYATHTLSMLQRGKQGTRIEPLAFLQKQLGHASINTTAVYLHVVDELVDSAVLAHDAQLDDWPGAAD